MKMATLDRLILNALEPCKFHVDTTAQTTSVAEKWITERAEDNAVTAGFENDSPLAAADDKLGHSNGLHMTS